MQGVCHPEPKLFQKNFGAKENKMNAYFGATYFDKVFKHVFRRNLFLSILSFILFWFKVIFMYFSTLVGGRRLSFFLSFCLAFLHACLLVFFPVWVWWFCSFFVQFFFCLTVFHFLSKHFEAHFRAWQIRGSVRVLQHL